MSFSSGEVLGPVERRRRFSLEQKLAILAEATMPGASISDVARRHGLVPSQVFKWRRLAQLGVIGIAGASELPAFVSVEIAADRAPQSEATASALVEGPAPRRSRPGRRLGLIEIELGGGRCVRVDREVDAAALRRVLDVLAER
jgi:transposase